MSRSKYTLVYGQAVGYFVYLVESSPPHCCPEIWQFVSAAKAVSVLLAADKFDKAFQTSPTTVPNVMLANAATIHLNVNIWRVIANV